MQELIILAKHLVNVSDNKVTIENGFNYRHNGNKTLLQTFFENLVNDKYSTDLEASSDLFPEDEAEDSVKYRMLKSRLRSRIDDRLLIQLSKREGLSRRAECFAALAKASYKSEVGWINLAKKHINRAIKVAEDNAFTDLLIQGLIEKKKIYESDYRKLKLKYEDEQIGKLREILNIELTAQSLFEQSSLAFMKGANSRKTELLLVDNVLHQISNLLAATPSRNIQGYLFELTSLSTAVRQDYKQLFDYHESFRINEETFDPISFRLTYVKFLIERTRVSIGAKKYSAAYMFLEELNTKPILNPLDALLVYECKFVTHLRLGDFSLAEKTLTVVTTRFGKLFCEADKLKWWCFTAYLGFLTQKEDEQSYWEEAAKSTMKLPVQERTKALITISFLQLVASIANDKPAAYIPLFKRIEKLEAAIPQGSEDNRTMRFFLPHLKKIILSGFSKIKIDKADSKILPQIATLYDGWVDGEIIDFEPIWKHLKNSKPFRTVDLVFGK